MSFTGSAPNKTYVRTDGVRTGAAVNVQARTAGANDTAELADARENDFATAINSSWQRNGDNQPSANLPMNGYKFTGAAVAAARDEFARASQVADSSLIYGGTAGGTADALTLDLSPSLAAYTAGQMVIFKAAADNTGAADINIDSLGSVNLRKFDGSAELAAGDIQNGGMYLLLCNGTDWLLVGALPLALSPFIPLTPAADKLAYYSGAATAALADFTAAGRALLDDADAAAQRTTLGLGTMAVETAANYLTKADNLNSVADKPTAWSNIRQAASDTVAGAAETATQAEMVTGTSTALMVTPGRQMHHPAHAKAWADIDQTGAQSINQGSGVSSLTDAASGNTAYTWSTAFAATTYGYVTGIATVGGTPGDGAATHVRWGGATSSVKTTTTLGLISRRWDGGTFANSFDSTDATVAAYGAQ